MKKYENPPSRKLALSSIFPRAVLTLWAVFTIQGAGAQLTGSASTNSSGIHAEQLLLRRLVEIAEGPPPTKESLASEFGFIFEKAPNYSESLQDYYATGHAPFDPGFAAGYLFIPPRARPALWGETPKVLAESVEISFNFPSRWPVFFCIDRGELERALKLNWAHRAEITQPHGIRTENYSKESGGYIRRAKVWPLVADCITSFHVAYETSRSFDRPEKFLEVPKLPRRP